MSAGLARRAAPGSTNSTVVPGGTVTSRRSTPERTVQEDSMRPYGDSCAADSWI